MLGSDVVANDTETIIVGFAKVILMRPWRAGEIVTAMVQLVTTIKVVFREFAEPRLEFDDLSDVARSV